MKNWLIIQKITYFFLGQTLMLLWWRQMKMKIYTQNQLPPLAKGVRRIRKNWKKIESFSFSLYPKGEE